MMKAQPDPLVFECDFEEPPEKVWRALTEPRLLEAWLTGDAPPRTDSTEERPLEKRSSEGQPSEERSAPYEILAAEPHRLLRYRWRDRESGFGHSGDREVHSVVTFELAPGAEGGTHLRLTHGDFRIVSATASRLAAGVRPITSARRARPRRTAVPSLVAPYSLRWAA